jgi:predicted signal transduction protein with EAL and GGDEF domain
MLIEATGLDGVRDRLGPLVCDEALRVLARRLVHSVRESDTISRVEGVQGGVARVGANELAILLTGIERLEDVTACARRLADRVQEPVPVLGQHLEVGAVMGIAMFPRDGSTASDLLGSARRAREDAKVGAEGSSHRFSAHRAINDEERALVIMSELPHVAQRGELQVLYQPRVELPSQRIIGAEALLRWQHPRLGEISPREFIEIAEREGSIEAIGTWVLAKACAEAARWGELRVSVNVSRSQLQSAGFANRVFQALIQARLRPDQLELEITESLMLEGESCLDPLRELDAVGVSLALDDFGSGYSSLSALVRFPIKVLKLDRSIVQQIDSNPHAARVLRGVVSLGQDLGMRVVAEGVDRAEQVALLLEAGCAEAQGFHFSRPIPARDFAALAAAARTTTP